MKDRYGNISKCKGEKKISITSQCSILWVKNEKNEKGIEKNGEDCEEFEDNLKDY